MNITFKDLEKANSSIATIDVKGKNYAEVNQRIKAFRIVYPTGFITSQIISLEGGVAVIEASCGYHTEDGVAVTLGTGHAYEKEGSTFINKTSYIENCETSAVGRALGMAGFGIDTSVASYEEVGNAIAQQESAKVAEEKANAKTVYTCQNCGNAFMGDDVAELSMKRWNKHICSKCINDKLAEVKKGKKKAEAKPEAKVKPAVDLPFELE